MFASRAILFCVLAGICVVAQAKGIFQAQGRVTEVQRSGDGITFRFAGWITAGYATAPEKDPKRRWVDIGWNSVDVPVSLGEWTRRDDSRVKDERPDVDATFAELRRLAASGHKVMFSVDNPGLIFTNRGELARVSGTYIYAHEMPK